MALHTKTVVNLMYTSRIIEDSVAGTLKPFGLSLQQYNVMRILRGQKGKPANLSTIQERMIDKSSNTTRLVDKLIKKGWVERSICEQNRRKVEILITPEGLDVLSQLDPVMENHNKTMLKNLSENDLEHLNLFLDTLRAK